MWYLMLLVFFVGILCLREKYKDVIDEKVSPKQKKYIIGLCALSIIAANFVLFYSPMFNS